MKGRSETGAEMPHPPLDKQPAEPDRDTRLRALAEAVGAPSPLPTLPGTDPLGEVDPEAVMTAIADRLLARVASLTETIRARQSSGLTDAVDAVTARVLLGDLALVAALWQVLGDATKRRLEHAITDLRQVAGAGPEIPKDAGE